MQRKSKNRFEKLKKNWSRHEFFKSNFTSIQEIAVFGENLSLSDCAFHVMSCMSPEEMPTRHRHVCATL